MCAYVPQFTHTPCPYSPCVYHTPTLFSTHTPLPNPPPTHTHPHLPTYLPACTGFSPAEAAPVLRDFAARWNGSIEAMHREVTAQVADPGCAREVLQVNESCEKEGGRWW